MGLFGRKARGRDKPKLDQALDETVAVAAKESRWKRHFHKRSELPMEFPVSPASVLEEFREFYQANKAYKLSYYGLMKFSGHGPVSIYDYPYAETLQIPFSYDSACLWESMPKLEMIAARQKAQYGTIAIGSEGCGIFWLLIVHGLRAGEVWLYTESGITPIEEGLTLSRWRDRCLESDNLFWREAVSDWGGRKNAFFYSHLAIQMAHHDQFTFGVPQPMCRICMTAMQHHARRAFREITITDPNTTRAFLPNRTVRYIDSMKR